jgi:DNA-binding PadR family transcriptional regulator
MHRRHHRHPFLRLLLCGMLARAFARHNDRGSFGPPWGDRGPWGGRGPWGFGPPGGGRRFGRGDLKYVILDLLQESPRHGYDIIRALEERFHGFYTPSAGSVYPTLQLLEDQGYVTSEQRDGKRVYTITDAGRAFLKENAETVEDVHARARFPHPSPELRTVMEEVRHTGETLFRYARRGGLDDPEKLRQLREVIVRARHDIEAIFRGDASSPDQMV